MPLQVGEVTQPCVQNGNVVNDISPAHLPGFVGAFLNALVLRTAEELPPLTSPSESANRVKRGCLTRSNPLRTLTGTELTMGLFITPCLQNLRRLLH